MKELKTITKEDIVRELQERGYNAKADCVIKNGAHLDAITIVGSADYSQMVSQINEQSVDPMDRLVDKAFIIEF